MARLPKRFFAGDALDVAPALLGARWHVGGVVATITEVEAYTADDPASHSYRGQTKRNAPMFGPPGTLYVYLIYGIYHCANIVTGSVGDGQAVLIRGVVVDGIDPASTDGPGKLCRVLGIDRSMNGGPARIDAPMAQTLAADPTVRVGITKGADLLRRWHVSSAG
ncbi:MAG TPA: DNA-3-methyladenine glycosylase [Ilumatobacteraceae bacterium]|nr:DNA-3-methyladenine glycosylase [Ilumatobacteraceae bacterium]